MPTTSIALTETPDIHTLLSLADDALILGHRTSEWTGRAPVLEEELALANIALDLIGQARALYQAAGALSGHTEDELAYLRDPHQFRNALIMELPNGDFAFTIARLFFVSVASDQRWRAGSADSALSAVAAKAMKETTYHVRHSAEWLIRLGDGTEESHRRAQEAVDMLWAYTGEIAAGARDGIPSISDLCWRRCRSCRVPFPVRPGDGERIPRPCPRGGGFRCRSRTAAPDPRRSGHSARCPYRGRNGRGRHHPHLVRLSGDA